MLPDALVGGGIIDFWQLFSDAFDRIINRLVTLVAICLLGLRWIDFVNQIMEVDIPQTSGFGSRPNTHDLFNTILHEVLQ